MSFLFWLLWFFDLLLATVSIAGGVFRGNLNLQNPFSSFHFWGILLGFAAVLGGPILRFSMKMPRGSLMLVALPMLVVLVFYWFDRD